MDEVATHHPDYDDALCKWEKCRDATAGQDAVHAAGEKYLPRLSEQNAKAYEAFKCRALYYNATGRTVEGLTGLIFRRAPQFELPASLEYLRDDVDTKGTPLLAFCEMVAEEQVTVGRFGLLTDYPPTEMARTQADEQAMGARPYVKLYTAESIINWRFTRVGNRTLLSLAVLSEVYEEPGEYAIVTIPQLRVLTLRDGAYQVELWRKRNVAGKETWIQEETYTPLVNGSPWKFIPFLICGPMGIEGKVRKSPINDIADVNLSHYRSTADYEHGLHFTGLPTPYVTGHTFEKGDRVALGSTDIQGFSNPNAKVGFLEFQGQGLQQLSKRLEEKESMMAALGARMLASEKRFVEAAETAMIHRAGENSVLASLANATSAAITVALGWVADFAAISEAPKVTLNTDYIPTGLTAQDLAALVSSWQAGAISYETLFDNLQRGEIARQDITAEDEKAAIDEEGPALGSVGQP